MANQGGFLLVNKADMETGPRLGGAAALYPAVGIRLRTDGFDSPALRLGTVPKQNPYFQDLSIIA